MLSQKVGSEMSGLRKWLPLAGLFALTALLATLPDPPRVGRQAPAFVLEDLRGKPVTLESFRGRPLLVNFWGTWCPPCRAELPELVRLADESAGCLEVVGVTLGSGSAAEIGAFAAAHAIRYPLLIGDARIVADYNVETLPLSVLVDAQGREVTAWSQAISRETVRAALQALGAQQC